MTVRYAVGVEYLGSAYAGWQRQPHADSVQARVERALSIVANAPVEVVCAGRTDAGVHALGQVVHFDSDATRAPRQWLLGANSNLPRDISLAWVIPVSDSFHARFGALGRRYRYLMHSGAARSGLWHGRAAEMVANLQLEPMRQAARALIGRHDFSAYRARYCQAKSPVRNLRELSLDQRGPWTWLEVEADGFLHHMVRNIAGVLMAIGRGDRSPDWAGEILRQGRRELGGITAPAPGLYFLGPHYDPAYGLPRPANGGFPL